MKYNFFNVFKAKILHIDSKILKIQYLISRINLFLVSMFVKYRLIEEDRERERARERRGERERK